MSTETKEALNLQLLFRSNESDWWNNACLRVGYDEFYRYADGYKRAADILAGHVDENNCDQDFVAFPILFLYRHYIELKLKETIQKGRQLLNEKGTYPTHHEIDKLWHLCKSIALKVWPDGDVNELALAEECILIFSHYDQASFAFRYPETKDGKLSLQGLEYANLRHVKDTMNQIAVLLDGMSIAIGEYLEYKQQMEREYANYW